MELKDQVLEKLIQRAAKLFKKEESELSAATRFEEDLKAKSVNYSQIITFLEDEFEVEISYMEFKRQKTFEKTAEYVARLCEN
jgi:Acyl carrier protein